MAENDGDKTEAPTPRRRQEAQEAGQVARSPDLAAAILLLTALVMLNATGGHILSTMKLFVARMLSGASLDDLDTSALAPLMGIGIQQVGIALLPLMAGIVIVAIIANVIQVGIVFNPGRLTPNFEALNPTRGFQKIFSGGIRPAKIGIQVAKLVVLSFVAYSGLHGKIGSIVTAQQLDFGQIFVLGSKTIFVIAMRLAVALLIIAIIEFFYARWRLEEDLKMTKQEVKEEMRRMEGDPKIKNRRRQVAMQRLRQKLKTEVPKASVVVTNPTHFAVALQYEESMVAPRVVAKGQDFIALKIREIAIEHGIPILERPPLARALYKTVEVGHDVPEQFYAAIAEILAYVYQLTGKRGAKAS